MPDAAQAVALTDDHVIVVVVLAGTDGAASVSVGAAGATKAGVTDSDTEVAADGPPRLLQVNVNVSVPTTLGVIFSLPLAANVPLQLPDAVQLVAPTDDQLIVVEPLTAIEVGVKDSAGAAGADPDVTSRLTKSAADVPNALLQLNV